MIARAEAKYIRVSPHKVRLAVSLIKGIHVKKAVPILKSLNKKAAFLFEKVLKSAIANAKSKGYEENKLYISKAMVNSGPILRRYRAASFGRATIIKKRTSHILIELDTHEKLIEQIKTK